MSEGERTSKGDDELTSSRPVAAMPASDPRLIAALRAMERFRFTVTRPVAVLMVFIAIVVFGGFSGTRLPLNLMPDISYPRLTVRTEYPGAAPAEVENNVSRPLEEILGVVTGLTEISSVSRGGYSDVILEFAWDTDMDDANQDVLEKLDSVKPVLPEDIKQPLILRYDPTLDPVLTLSLSGDSEGFEGIAGLKYLRKIADRDVRRLIEPIEGVAAVKVKGGLEEEIEIRLDEDELRRTGISIATVITRLQNENINVAGGNMRDGRTRYLVRTVNEFRSLEDMRDMVVVSRDGRDIKLRNIANVRSGYKDRDVITRVNGDEAVEIEVYKEADANIVDMAAKVTERLDGQVRPRIEKEYGAELEIITDRSLFIESSIDEVRSSALWGGLIAIGVLLLFLRDFKTTAIVAVAIPVSVLIAFAPMNLAGVSLNIMSLGGMALGIGMLVDNSIVVLESIHRCREEGDDLIRATLRGTSEVGSAVIAATLTSIAVFFPMVFVKGVAGQMFGDLGLTVVFSLLASLAVALFLIPMLASRQWFGERSNQPVRALLSSLGETWTTWRSVRECVADLKSAGWRLALIVPLVYLLTRAILHLTFELTGKLLVSAAVLVLGLVVTLSGGAYWLLGKLLTPVLWLFDFLLRGLELLYPVVIRWCLRNRPLILTAVLGAFASMFWAVPLLDTELIPEMHQGEFTVELNLPVGTPLSITDETMAPIEKELEESVPRLRTLVTTIGSERDSTESGERGEHTARMRVALTTQRSRTKNQKGAAKPGQDADSKQPEPTTEAAETAPQRDGMNSVTAEGEALDVVRPRVAKIPDANINVTRPVLFSFTRPIEVEIRGYELTELGEATNAVAARLRRVDGLRDVKSSILPGSPEIQIVYDRDALARYGLNIRDVADLVRNKVQGYEATKYNRKDRKIPVRVRLAKIDEATIDELRELVVNPGQMRPVPLSAVAELTLGRGPNEIRRIGQQRTGLVTANVEGTGLGSAVSRIRVALDELSMPAGVTVAVTGQSDEWETSSQSLYLALALSIFLVYVIMASQFESVIYPLIILFSIPLAGVGVVFALLLMDMPVSVVVFLGCILLAGIVVNNAIVLVDYVNQLKARGMVTEDALVLAGRVRLRPILMTTLTTVLGLLPMALFTGDGSEIRVPMALTVIAGLAFSTLLTLVVIPTIYAGFDRFTGVETFEPRSVELERDLSDVTSDQLVPEFAELAKQHAGGGDVDASHPHAHPTPRADETDSAAARVDRMDETDGA